METSLVSEGVFLAILPFSNHSGREELEYFGLGLVEELIVDLSHFSGLNLISSYTAKLLVNGGGELASARKLNIDYLLEGGFHLSPKKTRLNLKLIDTNKGAIIWAEKFDFPSEDLFDIQKNIVERVVFSISTEVELNQLAAARKKNATSLAAYDCYLRGMDRLRYGTLQADQEARDFFDQALDIDPYYSRAYAGLSLSYFNEWSCQLWDLYESSEQNAYKYAVKAFQLDDSDHIIHLILGRVYMYRRQFKEAEHHIEKSLELNNNDADSLVQLSTCYSFLGRAAKGEALFHKALRLNPYRNLWYYQYGSFTYFVLKQYRTSVELALKRQLTNIWVDLPGYIAAAHAHLGNISEAQDYIRMFIESFTRSINGGRTPTDKEIIDWVTLANPFKYPEDTVSLVDGLKRAGLSQATAAQSGTVIIPSRKPLPPTPSIFKQEKDVWRIEYENIEVILPDIKGYHDIARLLDQPEEDLHCTDLMGSESSMDESDPVIDEQARKAYSKHIDELHLEIEEAEDLNDIGRKEKLQEELEVVISHLSKSLGLGRKPRKLKAPSDRARAAVTQRIRSAIHKIDAHHPALGKHLSNSIRTGVFCRYSPEDDLGWITS